MTWAQENPDLEISSRLTRLTTATRNYPDLKIEVTEGLVILKGKVAGQERKTWLVDVTKKVPGVIAVIDETEDSIAADTVLTPAREEVTEILSNSYRLIPYIASSLIILTLGILLGFGVKRLIVRGLERQGKNVLLRQSIGNGVVIIFVLLGLYFALKSSGLSGLAVTVLGGTGFLGIGVGLALKSTFENYASGLMLSLRELFRRGEIIKIGEYEGVVQRVTTQATTIIDYSGNSIIIPNAQVVSSVIVNLTRNPLMRTSFTVGIGYDDEIEQAREVILKAIKMHVSDIVVQSPAPFVTASSLGSATVNLAIYFWFDASKLSDARAVSAVIEVVKSALMSAGISMPDDAREIIFSSPLKIDSGDAQSPRPVEIKKPVVPPNHQVKENDIEEIKEIAHSARSVEKGEDLLTQ